MNHFSRIATVAAGLFVANFAYAALTDASSYARAFEWSFAQGVALIVEYMSIRAANRKKGDHGDAKAA